MSLSRIIVKTQILVSFGLTVVGCNKDKGANRDIVDCNGTIVDLMLPTDMAHGALGLVTLEDSTKLAVASESHLWCGP